MLDGMVDLSLKEMTDLDAQFKKVLPAVVNSLKDESQSASITITLNFKLCPDSETQLDMKTSVKPSFATDKRVTRCRRDLVGNLKADSWDLGNAQVGATQSSVFKSEEN
ncbi:MAG: hypothetical protein RRY12_01410 [Cloacibacillus sp.]